MSIADRTVSFSLELNLEQAYTDIRRIETVLYRYFALLRRAGLPEELDDAVRKVQTLITIVNQLRLSMIAVHAASGPIGWLLAGIGATSFIITTTEFAMDL